MPQTSSSAPSAKEQGFISTATAAQQQPETSSSSATATPKASSLGLAEAANEKAEAASAPAPAAPHTKAKASAADPEAQRAANHRSHFETIFDQSGVTDAVRSYQCPGSGTAEDPYVIDFLPGGDAHNAMAYSNRKKWAITVFQAIATLAVAFVSTAYTGGMQGLIREFHISTEVAILGISLFVVGFAVGPLLWAPLSEMYGRQKTSFISYMAITVFCAGITGARNMRTVIVLRFFAGAFGSSPLTNSGGVLADMFSGSQRGLAMAVFAMAPFLGPAIGPIAGGFLGVAGGWRWVEGLMATFTGVLWIIGAFFIPETYAPVLLRQRAAALCKQTGKVYVSKLDVGKPPKTITQEFRIALSRPWILLFREPIVLLTALYMAIVYGTLYMMFAAFPIVFQQQRGWGPGVGGLAFVGVAIGMLVAVAYSIFDNKRYQAILAKNNGLATPEDRLPPAIIGSILLPVGLFWFAWTNGTSIHWVVPIIASGFFASGLCLVFLSLLNYLIDSYVVFAASVLAANSVLRSLFGAAFPLFTTQMYHNLGIHWASSIPAFLALACLPLPALFYKYGKPIRMKCKFSAEAAEILEIMRKQLRPCAPDEDEAMAEVEKHDRLVKAERVRSQDSRAAAEGLAEVAALVRVHTMREREERERERMARLEKEGAVDKETTVWTP